MQSELLRWTERGGWQPTAEQPSLPDAQWVLAFIPNRCEQAVPLLAALREARPGALVTACSTGTTLLGAELSDDDAVAVAVRFEATRVRGCRADVSGAADSREAGLVLARRLDAADLALVLVLSDGLNVNGSELAAGLTDGLGRTIPIAGGLAGDGDRFQATWTALDGEPSAAQVVAVGFYGDRLRLATTAVGGWDPFGPRRTVTRAQGNVLHELDGTDALGLYERYLGDEARDLPGSALLYPLQIWPPGAPELARVRTVLAIDHEARTMTFAGDIPAGWSAQLMRGHHERLVAGAGQAGRLAREALQGPTDDGALALLVSCVGRRLLMSQRTADEAEAVQAAVGRAACLGFYSYGELAPVQARGACELHNQTMTVTLLTERSA
ncbi:MAG TPA: FIST N-terminal domain-containing protein [Burkholderiaceae bacterium]|nr:FIST N-terminal domain-containing protein [Burkholderiaceae bacterium]HMX11285.1 FIST N-terminal domain-containing protein [Burkholderiaceae bacterium]HNB45552.1 FIST N-terminal domain-containing protein [Burkholderiaceae bacterium]HNG81100.1 FIST N-terminal domain-containing protein [Burkholderiaceae bacterium]